MTTIQTALNTAFTHLKSITDVPRLEAELLLSKIIKKPRTYLYTWPDKQLTSEEISQYRELFIKRASGVPIAYLIGYKEFWGQEFIVTRDTLIPRPETELLVQTILHEMQKVPRLRLIDIGTGTGAIALTLARLQPQWEIIATDTSAAAIEVAKLNCERFNLKNVTFHLGNIYTGLKHHDFEIIVSNPPYIAVDDPVIKNNELAYEPQQALVAGDDGLVILRNLIADAPMYLTSSGFLFVEHGNMQGAQVRDLFVRDFQHIKTLKDLAGHERVTFGQLR